MKLLCDGKTVSFVVAESLCGATVSLGDFLRLKDTVLDTHFCEPTIAIIEWQLRVCFTLRWSLLVRGQCLLPKIFYLVVRNDTRNFVQIRCSKSTFSLCGFILKKTAVQLHTYTY